MAQLENDNETEVSETEAILSDEETVAAIREAMEDIVAGRIVDWTDYSARRLD